MTIFYLYCHLAFISTLQQMSALTVTYTQFSYYSRFITNCQKLPAAWLYFVLGSAINYSNIFQSNEVPYVPKFLSLHSELQIYFMISKLAWT